MLKERILGGNMQLIKFSDTTIVIVDFIVWFIIHGASALIALKIPDSFFERDSWIYKSHSWENNGNIWQSVFKIKKWKKYLPDGAAASKKGFRKKYIQSKDNDYFKTFILESKRGELTHWLIMLPAPLFFLWNPFWVGWIMILYAILVNVPCIMAQRYNRPRFIKIISARENTP